MLGEPPQATVDVRRTAPNERVEADGNEVVVRHDLLKGGEHLLPLPTRLVEHPMERKRGEDRQVWVVPLEILADVPVQCGIRPPQVWSRQVDLVHLDADGQVVGPEELDHAPAIAQVSLHDDGIVVGPAHEFLREWQRLLPRLQVAPPRRDGEVDLAALGSRFLLPLPFVDQFVAERLVRKQFRPRHALDVVGDDVGVLA